MSRRRHREGVHYRCRQDCECLLVQFDDSGVCCSSAMYTSSLKHVRIILTANDDCRGDRRKENIRLRDKGGDLDQCDAAGLLAQPLAAEGGQREGFTCSDVSKNPPSLLAGYFARLLAGLNE